MHSIRCYIEYYKNFTDNLQYMQRYWDKILNMGYKETTFQCLNLIDFLNKFNTCLLKAAILYGVLNTKKQNKLFVKIIYIYINHKYPLKNNKPCLRFYKMNYLHKFILYHPPYQLN